MYYLCTCDCPAGRGP